MLDALAFTQSEESDQSLSSQLSQWIEAEIRNGKLPPGTRLQSVRTLAQQLGVNRGSVALAYGHLTKTGYLQTGQGRGTFVRSAPPLSMAGTSRISAEDFWQPLLAEMNSRLGAPKPAILEGEREFSWVPENGDTSGTTARLAMDLPLSDHRLSDPLIRDGLHKLATSLPRDALAYGHPQGLLTLRAQLAERARREGMAVESKEILICNGTQQALSLVCSLLIQPGDTVVMANPGYPGAARVFRMCGAKILGVPVDSSGMKVDLLEAMLRNHRPKLIYAVPTSQVPTGTTLSIERRLKLYRLAEARQIPILEDEYANALFYGDPPPPPLKSLDRQGLVIYVGTFSKTLGASLRIGWIAAHEALTTRLIQAKEAQDIHTSLISQFLIDSLLRDGTYELQLELLRDHYGERYRALVREMGRKFGSAPQFHASGGGAFSIWVSLPDGISAARWLHFARARGVTFHRGVSYFLEEEDDSHAQLCFSQLDPGAIEAAVEQLFLAFQEACASQKREASGHNPFLPFS